jgi:hypothetical protein
MTHPRRRPPRLPRRPLAAGLALVLVAALVPRALADDSGPAAASGTGEPQTLDVTAQAQAMTETFQPDLHEAEAPAAPEATGAAGELGTDPAEPAQGTGRGDRPTVEQEQQPTREPVVVAEHNPVRQEQGDQHDATGTGGSGDPGEPPLAGRDQSGRAGQGQQADPDAGQGCGAGGSCSTELSGSGASTAAVAGGAAGGFRGAINAVINRVRGALRGRSPQEPTELELADRDLGAVEQEQAELDAEGRTHTVEEHIAARVRLEQAVRRLAPLRDRPDVDSAQVGALSSRAAAALGRLSGERSYPDPVTRNSFLDTADWHLRKVQIAQGVRAASGRTPRPPELAEDAFNLEEANAILRAVQQPGYGRPEDPDRLADLETSVRVAEGKLRSELRTLYGNRMSVVGPGDVAGTPGGPSLKEQDKQLVDGAVGFPSPKGQDEQLVTGPTGGKVLTEQERELVTGNPGVTTTQLDTRPLQQQDTTQATSDMWATATDVAVQTGKDATALAGAGGVGLLYAFFMKAQLGQALLLALSPDVRKALQWMAPGPPPG